MNCTIFRVYHNNFRKNGRSARWRECMKSGIKFVWIWLMFLQYGNPLEFFFFEWTGTNCAYFIDIEEKRRSTTRVCKEKLRTHNYISQSFSSCHYPKISLRFNFLQQHGYRSSPGWLEPAMHRWKIESWEARCGRFLPCYQCKGVCSQPWGRRRQGTRKDFFARDGRHAEERPGEHNL